ncbi:hypothetical protein CP960_09630 [Malaciobacter halophilus]|uniref:Uncharacterized protein n=1 Tax=Malaciobacter halophilus TaxID=197482 RepID=A0A2N1J1G1_9BACT|nr:hypothetical protein [Malaciobacter halophilus]AXH09707.1 hypothetical protein AHALO_1332 [Malaciobacter halophilus]PKI80398.1 hypothetical protein CP960_09630 [Malaciobacter halophilus]
MNAQMKNETEKSTLLAALVVDLVRVIRNEKDFQKAAKIVIENNITMTEIVSRTLRLSVFDIAKLSDTVIELKK